MLSIKFTWLMDFLAFVNDMQWWCPADYETCADPQVVHPSISHEFREARHGGLCGTGELSLDLIYKNKSMTNAWNQCSFLKITVVQELLFASEHV